MRRKIAGLFFFTVHVSFSRQIAIIPRYIHERFTNSCNLMSFRKWSHESYKRWYTIIVHVNLPQWPHLVPRKSHKLLMPCNTCTIIIYYNIITNCNKQCLPISFGNDSIKANSCIEYGSLLLVWLIRLIHTLMMPQNMTLFVRMYLDVINLLCLI